MKRVHGVAFPDADAFMASQLGADGRYQGDHLDAALAFVTDWSQAIDGGAHVGTWSKALAERFDSVLAFEPAPDTYEALLENVKDLPNVVPLHYALGAGLGSVTMAIDQKNEARANTGARYVKLDGPIAMISIDSLNLKTLGFLKLDVEGSELPALLGARQTIGRAKPVVLFEDKGFGSRFGVKRGAIETFLTGLGYHKLAQLSADQIWGPA
ncbi:MAG: FkbM family methyltransferase [Vicinamibacterales bacterium]